MFGASKLTKTPTTRDGNTELTSQGHIQKKFKEVIIGREEENGLENVHKWIDDQHKI